MSLSEIAKGGDSKIALAASLSALSDGKWRGLPSNKVCRKKIQARGDSSYVKNDIFLCPTLVFADIPQHNFAPFGEENKSQTALSL